MSQSNHGKNQQAYAGSATVDHQNPEPNSEETHFQLPLNRKQGPDYAAQNCRRSAERLNCEGKNVLKRQYSQISKGSKNNSESYSPERKKMRIDTEKKETAVTQSIQQSSSSSMIQFQVQETNALVQLPLKRKQGPDYAAQNCRRSADSCSPPRKERLNCEGKNVLKRQYSQISKGSKNNSESYSPERKKMRIDTEKKETAVTQSIQQSSSSSMIQFQVQETNALVQLPLKRKQGPDYAAQNCRRSADSCSPPRKERLNCEGKNVLKRQYSQISKGSKNNSESYSPERKRMRIDTEKKETAVTQSIQQSSSSSMIQFQVQETNALVQLPLKRKQGPDYAAQNCRRSDDNCSPPRKERLNCEGKNVLKRQYSQISKGSKNNSESYSPERKKMRIDTEKKETAVTQSIQKCPWSRTIRLPGQKTKNLALSDTKTSENTLKDNKRPEETAVTQSIQKRPWSRTIQSPGQKTNDTALSDTKTSENTPKDNKRPEDQRETNVWIIGSSYIRRAESEAKEIFGENFGLNAKVQWFGKEGMRWRGVLPCFYEELSRQSPPDILVIHAGGNDLGLFSAYKLSSVIEKELMQLHAGFPSMAIAYSSINNRQVWRYGNPGKINKDREIVNASIRKAVDRFAGVIIEHPCLRFVNSSTFLPDGVHLTKKGNELFLTSIHSAIQKSLQSRH
ncbi:unnamed protein product [Oreochromis niloticus]|nr:unnamed protein product [Mustela putorius furo]